MRCLPTSKSTSGFESSEPGRCGNPPLTHTHKRKQLFPLAPAKKSFSR